ncbi:MAG: hypothetical protein IPK71_27380 [Myxococcales bacterium]|nr:hypothetical protein [Myxococcales bacterium]
MTSSKPGRVLLLALSLAAVSLPAAARADGASEVARFASVRTIKSNVVPPGKAERYGRAEVLVAAPIEAVRHEVTSYKGYAELAPDKFNRSKIIAKENGETDVYMQVPVLGGLVVLWQVMRFSPVQGVGTGVEHHEGRYVRGNLKNASVLYTLTKVDDKRTILRMDLLVLPNMAVPQAVLDEELRDAAAVAAEGMRDRAERKSRPSPAEIASAQPQAPATPSARP